MNWLKWLIGIPVILLLLLILIIYLALKLSLPDYQGNITTAVANTTILSRDQQGYLTITAEDRNDAAYALGFAHAQERFFQMDLTRRQAAGELAELFGDIALALDISHRQHRLRHRAEQALSQLPLSDLQLLSDYSRGVNDGLQQLTLPPFEYLLLRKKPLPWQETDSLLMIYSMYLELQGEMGKDEYAMTLLKQAIPEDWYAFLQQHSADWQAALDGSEVEPVAVPDSAYPAILRSLNSCHKCTLKDSTDIGSNNFAVAGSLTSHGSAILADDMHLGIRVPATWYKTQLNWQDNDRSHQVTGLSLPGTPAIVVGSNGQIAWGFTNSTADWHDLIRLTVSEDGKQYLTADGWQPFQFYQDVIRVNQSEDHLLTLKETHWGPVISFNETETFALRWAAYDSKAVNLNLVKLEKVQAVSEALSIGSITGIPAQNLLVADNKGQIGWTIMGAIPYRQLNDWDTAQDWSKTDNFWQDYININQHPFIFNPPSGRLWTANSRTMSGETYQLLGNGGYDLGARGMQIRDALFAKTQFNEQDLHAIQLDQQAVMLQRWKQLLLSRLTPETIAAYELEQYHHYIETSAKSASTDDIGYSLVRAFREQTLQQLFVPLSAYLEQHGAEGRHLKYSLETPGWALLQLRREDTLPEAYYDYDDLLLRAILDSKRKLEQQTGALNAASWGKLNQAKINHPLSSAVPIIGKWLNMPADELAGDSHMPRVQRVAFGQSQRMVVSPGQEQHGILTIPAGQSGHPLSPFYRADHPYWVQGAALPFLPGAEKFRLTLHPQG